MVQLQRDIKQFQDAGMQVVGLSPDSVDKLKSFATQKEIKFPLLSDGDGSAIKSLGLLNENAKKLLPHPGTLLIGSDGVIYAKLFKEGYRARHDNSSLLVEIKRHTGKLKPSAKPKLGKEKELQPAGG